MVNLPMDIVNMILDYDGRIKYKGGQYINIIHKHDKRYGVIKINIPQKVKNNDLFFSIIKITQSDLILWVLSNSSGFFKLILEKPNGKKTSLLPENYSPFFAPQIMYLDEFIRR